MKKLVLVLVLAILFVINSCKIFTQEIDGEKVNVDTTTFLYTYKENGKKVTGNVVFYSVDPNTGKKYKSEYREVKEGVRINTGKMFYPSGAILAEYQFDATGLITGTVKMYYESGQLFSTTDFLKNKENGLCKQYNISGIQSKEIVYENGSIVKEYEFDSQGVKIIPAIDLLEIVDFETGFYELKDFNSYQILYQPIVILKLKNSSTRPISERIEINGVFIEDEKNEEWGVAYDLFQIKGEPPFQPGLIRQVSLKSDIGYRSSLGIYNSNITCQVIINKLPLRKFKISNSIISSNRL